MAKKQSTKIAKTDLNKNSDIYLKIDSITFEEFAGDEKEWTLSDATFGQINLIVGRNSSGKTRLLNVVAGLPAMLTGARPTVFISGDYDVKLSSKDNKNKYAYSLKIKDGRVTSEILKKNGKELLQRGKDGVGKIWAEKNKTMMDFEVPPDQLAARNRLDKIQHPFFEDLNTWASNLRLYRFGTEFGKHVLMPLPESGSLDKKQQEIFDSNEVTRLYANMYERFGEKFDKSILRDLDTLGYQCTEVGAEALNHPGVKSPFLCLFLKEKDLKTKTTQLAMSQGMFRALSLVIHLNYCIFRALPRTILIDDIGEGLDFERAKQFISLLIERAEKNNLQLIMTSNDRFIMNGVPLENWGIVSRKKSTVKLINTRNSQKVFKQFEDLGLNNFDFFATNFFEDGLQ